MLLKVLYGSFARIILWFADQGVDDDTIKTISRRSMAVITDYLTGKRKPKRFMIG